jgi:hypothetical protein
VNLPLSNPGSRMMKEYGSCVSDSLKTVDPVRPSAAITINAELIV